MLEKETMRAAFLVNKEDNVVTLLQDVSAETKVRILGDVDRKEGSVFPEIMVLERISAGHKAASCNIASGADIIKYGVVIGRASKPIKKGEWVHLHCMHSVYDERSSHLDVVTGAPADISYE